MKIIAELCQNHIGDINILKKMVEAAAQNGATHVKVQHIFAKNLVYRPVFEKGLSVNGVKYAICRPWKTEFQRIKALELTHKNYREFVDICRSFNVEPLTTCFTRDQISAIRKQGFSEIKVASYDCASYQLLRDLISAKFKRIYVSTGATHQEELRFAAEILQSSNVPFELLHCVTIYPTPLHNINLSRMRFLQKFKAPVGFSDHSSSQRFPNLASMVAIYLKAQVIERHFSILSPGDTKDGKISIGPSELGKLAIFSKLPRYRQKEILDSHKYSWEKIIGNYRRYMSKPELLNRAYYRGRFASRLSNRGPDSTEVVFNWEETPL